MASMAAKVLQLDNLYLAAPQRTGPCLPTNCSRLLSEQKPVPQCRQMLPGGPYIFANCTQP
jgi:hypothetical protein